MGARFSDDQVLEATGATRAQAGARSSYSDVRTDSRQLEAGCLFVALKGERFDAHDFLPQAVRDGAAGLVVETGRGASVAGLPVAVFEVQDTLAALGALAHFHRERFDLPLCAVGGSNGKTTTKELVAAILNTRGPALKTQGNLNNEVGLPLTLFQLESRHVSGVVELGMNRPGEVARLTAIARPLAGLITVVQPEHLEGLGSIEGVAKAEGELFRGLSADATAVVNLEDARVVEQAQGIAARRLTFGRGEDAQVRLVSIEPSGKNGLGIVIRYQGRDYPVALRLVGFHNAMNATGAFALALALGYSPEACVRGLESASAYARRLELHDAPGGITVIDDCYNANPASMSAALDTVAQLAASGRAVAVLGDMLELGPEEAQAHRDLGVEASDKAAVLAFFGPRSKTAADEATRKLGTSAAHFTEVAPLLAFLKAQLRADDFVLVKGSRGMRLERVVAALLGTSVEGAH